MQIKTPIAPLRTAEINIGYIDAVKKTWIIPVVLLILLIIAIVIYKKRNNANQD